MKTSEITSLVLLFIIVMFGICIIKMDRRIGRLEEKWEKTPPILEIQEHQREMDLQLNQILSENYQ